MVVKKRDASPFLASPFNPSIHSSWHLPLQSQHFSTNVFTILLSNCPKLFSVVFLTNLPSFSSPSYPTSGTYVSTTTFWKVASADFCSLFWTSEEFLHGNTVWWKLPKGLQIGWNKWCWKSGLFWDFNKEIVKQNQINAAAVWESAGAIKWDLSE